MSYADISLDDIIAREKKKKSGARRDSGGRPIKRRGRGFTQRYSSSEATFTKTRDVPDGKWGHDGFDELYGEKGLARSSKAPIVRAGGKSFGRTMLNRKVKLHITNLAATVNTADLNELLENFPVDSVVVHYDELGQSVGTADVLTDRASAEEIKTNFSGVALDGKTMHMFIIDEAAEAAPAKRISERLSVGKRPVRVSRGIAKRRETRPFRSSRSAGIGLRRARPKARRAEDKRKAMTDAELDKELEEYMKKGPSGQAMEK